MKKLNAFDWLALILILVGALNWGLVGVFEFDLVAALFGPMTVISRVVYSLVGLAALYFAAISATIAKK
jgi:hypothetical protein